MSPNWVGDTIMSLPVLTALARSGRSLHVLAKPHLGPLLRLAPSVDTVLERSSSDRETISLLAAAELEEAVILPNSFRSAWLPYKAGIPARWGYRKSLRTPLLAPGVPLPGRDRHQTEDYVELLAAMRVPAPANWQPRLPLATEDLDRGDQLLRRAGLEPGEQLLVGLFPGAEFGPSKQWPWRRFAELAQAIRRRMPTVRCVTVAGPKESWLGVRIHEETGGAVPVIGPDLDLAALAAVLARLDLLVTNDSGPMHLAAAVDTHCVALFGPTDAARTRPCGDGHRVVDHALWCAPCFRRHCPLLHHRCLRGIAIDEVAAEIESIVAV